MKKLILSIATIAVFAFTSCSSDDDNGSKSCEQLLVDIQAALEAYGENVNEANCNAYKAALQAYVNKNCAGSGQYATIIAELDCSEG
ncbi:MAG: hypothetical protein WDZ45_08995 [Flavobacteriaceae bacterium]